MRKVKPFLREPLVAALGDKTGLVTGFGENEGVGVCIAPAGCVELLLFINSRVIREE
ncbi:MAG: hypothetical protein JXA30_22330 [Deltaproteobacteria bacterium]|nr:hypothetical protein [Deltaproteobacteria bacterium]